nr:hypothetical protein [Bradyrhizobium sp. CCBAU 51765]
MSIGIPADHADIKAAGAAAYCLKRRVTAELEAGLLQLVHNTTGAAKDMVMGFYQRAIPAESVARAIAYAIEQPVDVDISEIVVRSTGQPL